MADGGLNALCGFLWQFMGAAAIVAQGYCQGYDPQASQELDALITATRRPGAASYAERGDADMMTVDEANGNGERRCILAQFKYSRDTTSNTVMDHGDIQDAIDKLDAQASQARANGLQPVAYVLVTNRDVTWEGTARHERAQRLTPDFDLFLPGQHVLTRPHLYIAEAPTMAGWHDALFAFARRFGLNDDDEIEDGITHLMGVLLSAGGGSTRVDATLDQAAFTKAFTGSSDTRFLTADEVAPRSRQSIDELRSDWQTDSPLVRRDVLDEIVEKAQRRALVVVSGQGGCGKTAALLQWVDATMASGAGVVPRPASDNSAFVALAGANHIQSNWVSQVISAWGDWSAGGKLYSDDRKRVWERLRAANLDADLPLLHLGLDGLDEDTESDLRKDALRDILRWFWDEDVEATRDARRPRMTLVVTCRQGESTVEDILRLRRHGGPSGAPAFEQVRVGDFSDSDLRQAIALLPDERHEIRARLESAINLVEGLQGQEDNGARFGSSAAAITTPAVPPASGATVDWDVYAALKHPATWDAFFSLDADSQVGALDGRPESTTRLGRVIVRRACKKAHERHSSAFPNEDDLMFALRDVARRITFAEAPHPFRLWTTEIGTGGIIASPLVLRFYREMESAGLIVEEAHLALWRWRHKMVWEALATGTDGDWSRS